MSRLAAGAVSALLGALIGVGVLVVLERSRTEAIAPVAAAATEITSTAPDAGAGEASSPEPREPVADPVRVVIPAIDVDADLVAVGLNPDQSMEVPDFGEAGWYEPGPRPGEPGPAVIAAHVDSVAGPDVFYRLRELEPGDEITVEHADGARSTFAVRDAEQQDKDDLPVERIWNDTDDSVLRLITCGGEFDRQRRSYESNVIVYADARG
ncbi:MAG TPA: class F sortase [Euzebyales bacterium]|nr:class F sortase [Euzebyales bacterium]